MLLGIRYLQGSWQGAYYKKPLTNSGLNLLFFWGWWSRENKYSATIILISNSSMHVQVSDDYQVSDFGS